MPRYAAEAFLMEPVARQKDNTQGKCMRDCSLKFAGVRKQLLQDAGHLLCLRVWVLRSMALT